MEKRGNAKKKKRSPSKKIGYIFKKRPVISALLIVLMLFLLGLAGFYWYIYADSLKVDKALSALKAGNLEEGLELCYSVKLSQYADVCFINYIGRKIDEGQDYDKYLCDNISEKRQREKQLIGCYG